MLKDFEVSNINLLEDYSNAFGDKIRDAFEKAKRDRDELIERAKRATGDAKKKLEKAVEDAKKKVEAEDRRLKDMKKDGGLFTVFNQITQKFNPASAVPRGAGLALVRLNWMGIARKLHPALLTESELKAKHYDLENAKKLKALWNDKIKPFWENLGGDISALKKATLQGFDKPVFKTKKVKEAKRREQGSSSADGVGCGVVLSPFNKWANGFDFSIEESKINLPIGNEFSNYCEAACVGALIGAGGSIVVAGINALAKKGGAKDNPFDPNSPEYAKAQEDPAPAVPPLTAMDDEQLRAIALSALEDRKKNGLDPNTYEAEYEAIEKKYGKKFLGMPQTTGIIVTTLVGLGLIIGTVIIIKK